MKQNIELVLPKLCHDMHVLVLQIVVSMAQCGRVTPLHSASIGFKSVQLFKDEPLGIGSYGKVCRAKCDHLPCAAKIIHETLIDSAAEQQMPRGQEHRLPIRRFEQECEFLNTIRHPNVIQYLGMHRDPDTGLPVLLMELMDDSLTHFLESSIQPIPYYLQVNLCHDIILALTFLHANGIVHRDLSSNNVLLIGNIRAKVTDFGMAQLGDLNPRASYLTFTMCPGTNVYMPPEATKEKPMYTEKIDCFSFGVIVVQILTRQFPKPGDQMQRVEINHPGLPRGTLMVCIPEVDRRQNHINQVDPNHTLLVVALDCLKDKDTERPSAQQLCERVEALKGSTEYTESARAADLKDQVQTLKEQHTRQIQDLQEIIQSQANQLVEKEEAIEARKRDIQQLREQLEQATLQANEREQLIEKLQRQLKQVQVRSQDKEAQEEMVRDNIQLSWVIGNSPPQSMSRWCNAAVDGTMVYFNAGGHKMYSYDVISDLWTQLPDCPNEYSSFVVIDNLLTAIGGVSVNYSNKLHSFKEDGQAVAKESPWVGEFPPMPTKRASTTAICIDTALIVAGGWFGRVLTNCPVEVMHRESRQWSIAADIPVSKPLSCASGVICGDHLYVLGAMYSKSVYSCSLSDLLQSCQSSSPWQPGHQKSSSDAAGVWSRLTDLPVESSTCVSLCGHLLAIGGKSDTVADSKAVYVFKQTTNSWEVISQMLVSRRQCFAVTLPTNKLIAVGGLSACGKTMEVANLL